VFQDTGNGAGAGARLTILVPTDKVEDYENGWGVSRYMDANVPNAQYGSSRKLIIITDGSDDSPF
jgi:hypothetical protein